MTTHDGRGRELDALLGQANEQIDRLREATDRSGNVVRFRTARYLESLHELAVDLNERSRRMPPADTYERRKFELRFPKGSTWVLDVEEGQVVRGSYLPAT